MSKHTFPISNYTPNGYIDNPYHTRNLSPSGVLRTSHHVGLGWWYPTGRIGTDDMGAEYVSSLLLAFEAGGKALVTRSDYDKHGVALTSRYHSKNVLSYDFEVDGLSVSASYYLNGEHSLICEVEASNSGTKDSELSVSATNHFQMITRKWWGADGLAGYYVPEDDAVVQTIWAGGHQFALGASSRSIGHAFANDESNWIEQTRKGDTDDLAGLSSMRVEPMFGTLAYRLDIPAGASKSITLCLARGVNSKEARETLKEGLKTADSVLKERLAEDDVFWKDCAMLTGDWPERWKHGWVYDVETQRMNSRQPVGIYKHRWDAMQVHEPRAVLGETGVDALLLSYADMPVALEELYGVFADAPYPNVPCTREDGSMNMIAADGSECGTAPSWCFPFHVIHSVYCRTRDREWLAKLYPYLCDFIDWWFENRTDADGWFHCKCSWESGQDGSRRFLLAEDGEGAVADYVRTVDVEAGVAEALANLAVYAKELGKEADAEKWRKMADYRIEKVREMFIDDWYRDIDARNGKPIVLEDYIDIMMMAPVSCGVATPEQVEALEPKFDYFRQNQQIWLEWPSFVFPFSEAAWYSGHREFIADALFEVTERTYTRIDAHDPEVHENKDGLPSYTVTGVAREFWPLDPNVRGGAENYGWGATMPINVVRSIFGFREDLDFTKCAFMVSPTVPSPLLQPGKTLGITNLNYRGVVFDLNCTVGESGQVTTEFTFRSDSPVTLSVSDETGEEIATSTQAAEGKIVLSGANGSVYRFDVEAMAG